MRSRGYREQPIEIRRGGSALARLAGVIGRHRRRSVGILMGSAAIAVIFINALFLQPGPHPAPIFSARQVTVNSSAVATSGAIEPVKVAALPLARPAAPPAARTRSQTISEIQRELSLRGFYDGSIDGVWGARTDAAAREFVQSAGLKANVEASDGMLRLISAAPTKTATPAAAPPEPKREDPIAKITAPSKRVLAIQHALADYGYGQIKPTGVFDPPTQAAIEKFEQGRNLPVTGQVSGRVVRELASMTGRPLE